MPFFNFRRTSSTAAAAAQPESMEAIRKRAKHRLIGAAVLVLVGVIGFPLLFDTQPRPIAVDIPIEIPGKNSVKPLAIPPKPEPAKEIAAPAPLSAPLSAPAQDKVATSSSLGSKEEIVIDNKPTPAAPVASPPKKETAPAAKPETKPAPKAETKIEAKPDVKPASKVDDGARAKAMLDGQSATPPAASGQERLVVQVGAFADAGKAKEVRQKLEKAGLKTYTHVAETPGGKRIRVRVGPFANRDEAEKAANKIKALDLPTAILIL